jgi:hypothetical protein
VITLHLSDQEVSDIAEALDSPDLCDRTKKKLLVITMHHEGAEHGFIARCLRLSSGSLTAYLKEYRDGGLARVVENRYYKPSSALEPFLPCLECSLQGCPRCERQRGCRPDQGHDRSKSLRKPMPQGDEEDGDVPEKVREYTGKSQPPASVRVLHD